MKIRIYTLALLLIVVLKVYSQGNIMLRKEQAVSDIDSLVFAISEVHPNMFSACKQGEFFKMANDIKESLPDSVSAWQLYVVLQPLIVKIGDGHTSLMFPYNDVLKDNTPRIPLNLTVTEEGKLQVVFAVENQIPAKSEILSINGVTVQEMFQNMLAYQSGETEAFKINRVQDDFYGFFFILYPTDTYNIEYIEPGKTKSSNISLKACLNREYFDWKSKTQPSTTTTFREPYSFQIMPEKNVAIMDFNSFYNPTQMEQFADSMFNALRQHNINNLIIDVRENGGGSSQVGDIMLSYISDKPFCQYEKYIARVTPSTQRLLRRKMDIGWYYGECSPEDYIKPKTMEEGHFNGNVYLLTSTHSFSAAASFSWAFKEFGMGKVIGEETGGICISFGDVLMYQMPYSKLTASISYKQFWQYNADENHIHGTIPDYCVPRENALSKALELCNP